MLAQCLALKFKLRSTHEEGERFAVEAGKFREFYEIHAALT